VLDFESDYSRWRASRLKSWPRASELSFISIEDPANLNTSELVQLRDQCAQTNFALYRVVQPELATKETIRTMVFQLGMVELDQNLCADYDSISTLKVMDLEHTRGYIPYTDNALSWHTDGYYNPFHQHIRSFLLHCVQNASHGGENILINHELIYIKLHDKDPSLTRALMRPNALTIPANVENGVQIRDTQTGPVFYRDPETNCLQMRYTARTRSVKWKENALVRKAANAIEEFLKNDDELVLKYKLQPGEGLACNNILHGRTAFTNGSIPANERILYRARSYNRLFANF